VHRRDGAPLGEPADPPQPAPHREREQPMADIVGERVQPGEAIVNYEDKVFPDHQAEPGQ